jgi:hypothetical protein
MALPRSVVALRSDEPRLANPDNAHHRILRTLREPIMRSTATGLTVAAGAIVMAGAIAISTVVRIP